MGVIFLGYPTFTAFLVASGISIYTPFRNIKEFKANMDYANGGIYFKEGEKTLKIEA